MNTNLMIANPIESVLNIEQSACGKTILLGEHAAVYGYNALAIALTDVRLNVNLHLMPSHSVNSNNSVLWNFSSEGVELPIDDYRENQLHKALQTTYEVCNVPPELRNLIFKIEVKSQIPLGGGMGGSAALSVALVRSMIVLLNGNNLFYFNSLDIAAKANKVDAVFHGVASGLDVAAVCHEGAISFERGLPVRSLKVGKCFWLLLIDSGQRISTEEMVDRVKQMQKNNELLHKQCMDKLGEFALHGIQALENGDLQFLGNCMTQAHAVLKSCQVSTAKLDSLCVDLLNCGALGAKLTGGGGGGLVLGLFEKSPEENISYLKSLGPLYTTFVSAE